MTTIGYMGIPGSFSEVAAEALIRQRNMTDATLVPMVCSKNILAALCSGEAAYGVLGVTNTTAGPVREFEEAFGDVAYEVLGEYVLPIHHCVFTLPDVREEEITQIASHPQAFRQTDMYRARHYPDWRERETEDTALAAQQLAQGILPASTAVICSRQAGEAWNLAMRAENIEDSAENRTTFWLIRLTS